MAQCQGQGDSDDWRRLLDQSATVRDAGLRCCGFFGWAGCWSEAVRAQARGWCLYALFCTVAAAGVLLGAGVRLAQAGCRLLCLSTMGGGSAKQRLDTENLAARG
jgi:hypothetical protein